MDHNWRMFLRTPMLMKIITKLVIYSHIWLDLTYLFTWTKQRIKLMSLCILCLEREIERTEKYNKIKFSLSIYFSLYQTLKKRHFYSIVAYVWCQCWLDWRMRETLKIKQYENQRISLNFKTYISWNKEFPVKISRLINTIFTHPSFILK